MADLQQIRQALATNVGTVSGLRTSYYVPGQVNPPIAVIYPTGAPIEYHLSSNNGSHQFYFEVMIIVGRADEKTAQKNLDAYLSTTDTSKSVFLAIESDRTLGGTVQDCVARRVSSYGSTDINQIEYLAATIQVDVIAS